MKNFIVFAISLGLGTSTTCIAEKIHKEGRGATGVSLSSPLLSTQNINAAFSQTAVDPVIGRGMASVGANAGQSFKSRIQQRARLNEAPAVEVNPAQLTPQNSNGNMPDNRQNKTTAPITSRAGNISLQEANGDDWGSKVSYHTSKEGDYICIDRGQSGTECTEPGTATRNSAQFDQKVWKEYMEATNAEGIPMAQFHGCPDAATTGSCPGGPGVGSVKLMTTGNVAVNAFSGAQSSDPMDPKNLYYGYPNGDVTPNDIAAVFVVNGRARAGGGMGADADKIAEGL